MASGLGGRLHAPSRLGLRLGRSSDGSIRLHARLDDVVLQQRELGRELLEPSGSARPDRLLGVQGALRQSFEVAGHVAASSR
jgi:hypothetical protein